MISALPQLKGSIYYMKHMSLQPFSMGVDQPEIESIYFATLILAYTGCPNKMLIPFDSNF